MSQETSFFDTGGVLCFFCSANDTTVDSVEKAFRTATLYFCESQCDYSKDCLTNSVVRIRYAVTLLLLTGVLWATVWLLESLRVLFCTNLSSATAKQCFKNAFMVAHFSHQSELQLQFALGVFSHIWKH